MPGEKPKTNGLQQTNKPTLRIVEGGFVQPVEQGHPQAVERHWEVNGNKGTAYEIPWESWSGKIVDISFRDSEFGKTCSVELEDAVIYLKTKSKYFRSLAERVKSCDLSKEIYFRPYDFESDDGKRLTGISVQQGGEKKQSYYFDYDKRETVNGMPQPEEDKKGEEGYWAYYFAQVSSFLVKELEGLEFAKPKEVTIEDLDEMFED